MVSNKTTINHISATIMAIISNYIAKSNEKFGFNNKTPDPKFFTPIKNVKLAIKYQKIGAYI